ncbi:unnamed protein product [Euphydryas editha]|uniref:Uncharacterized protein n=1 Tax=Euphydryas editha TaxID=104508 RepID=A0AAU9TV59_EUPED|nr:unnamed protein product [Euphydryas editha]
MRLCRLIVLGLDQFWWYVDNNPELFKRPAHLHPRRRWGLGAVTNLISRYMLPFLTPRSLLAHVHVLKKKSPKDSVIAQYFKNNKIKPVKHKLLPYNPKITLYEQPEFEIPRLWIKYLAKNSKRFRDHMLHPPVLQPAGVEIDLSKTIESVERPPLPIDFTKTISCNRINMHPVKPSPELVDKVDVHIQNCEENVTASTTFFVASNIYTLVDTSKGAQLIPLQAQTSTVNSASTPIFSPAIVNSIGTKNIINPEAVDTANNEVNVNVNEEDKTSKTNTDTESIGNDDGHCKCCKLIKKIRRKRQTLITEYFNGNKNNKNIICDCRGKKYPRITNKLRLLVNNYKTLSKTVYNEVLAKLDRYKNGKKRILDDKRLTHDIDFKDLVSAVMFQIKLVERANKIRNTSIKIHIHNTFAKFDVENGDPLELTEKLLTVFDVDLADMYKEFMGFLTAEQADKINNFKDYFIRSCIPELMAKIEEHILDDVKRQKILQCIKGIILNNSAQACEICCKLLNCSNDYPVLAQYIYSLFPHQWREKVDTCSNSDINKKDYVDSKESALKLVDKAEAIVAAKYEADNSSSDEEATEFRENVSNHCSSDERQANNQDEKENKFNTPIKYEQPDELEMTIDESIHSSRESSDDNMSMIIMSDDESYKVELPDWKREEDKLILEVLKQSISPEEMKDQTLIEIIENKNIVNMLADSLSHKSLDDVRGRMLYLLEILGDDNIH